MADFVQLLEDDVAGAKLDTENLNKYTVTVLDRWLQWRGLPRNGSKRVLIKRILNHVKAGDSHILNPGVDCGKPLEAKKRRLIEEQDVTTKKPMLPFPLSAAWRTFPGYNIPELFNEGHVYHYLVETMPKFVVKGKSISVPEDEDCEVDEGLAGTEKLFTRAKRLVDSQYILDMLDSKSEQFYIVKAFVRASMRLDRYPVVITLSSKSGSVLEASCTCKASDGGRCSHVGAVLLFLSKYVKEQGYKATSCTGRPREWGKGAVLRDPGKTVRPEYYKKWNIKKRHDFDPRPTSERNLDLEEVPNVIDNFLKDLMCVTYSKKPSAFIPMMPFKYEPFDLTQETIQVLEIQRAQFYEGLLSGLGKPGSRAPMRMTINQGDETWIHRRSFLFTASIAKQVCQLTIAGRLNFLRKHLWALDPFQGNYHTRYGQQHEDEARRALQGELRKTDPSAAIQETGLWVSQRFPYLGCSPDGLVKSNYEASYVIEIKCPSTLKMHDPNDFDSCLTKKQLLQFPLTKDQGIITLKASHSHFYQVQMVMGVMNMKKCVYFVWSPKGHISINVPFNETFWEEKRELLSREHRHFLVPEYFLMRAPRFLDPINLP